MRQLADVARTVTDERERLLSDAGKNQFAVFPVGKLLASVRIDDFRIEEILAGVHARLLAAFIGNAGTRNFGKAIDIISFDVENLLDFPAHIIRPGFRAENAGAQLQLFRVYAHVARGFADVHRIGRRTAENCRTQITHKLDLTICISGRHRECKAPTL